MHVAHNHVSIELVMEQLEMNELEKRICRSKLNGQKSAEFFEENDEMEICKKACEKLVKKGKTDEKLIAAMMQAGFSYKMIKLVLEK